MRIDIVTYLIELSAIVPLGIGLYKIKKIHKSYNWLLLYLMLDFIYQFTFPFLNNNWISNVFEVLFDYASIFCLLFLLYDWGYLKNNNSAKKKWILLFLIFPVLDLAFQKRTGLRPPWIFIIASLTWIGFALKYVSIIKNSVSPTKTNRSKFLIILPIACLVVYYTVLQILMANLYNDKMEAFFRLLYNLIIILRIATFTCFCLAFFWAPKQEIYLDISQEQDTAELAN